MATLKVSDLKPAGIYRDKLSGMKVRVSYIYGDRRAMGVFFSTVTDRFIPIEINDDELEELDEEQPKVAGHKSTHCSPIIY